MERNPFLFAIDFEMTKGIFVINPLYQQEILFNIKGLSNALLHRNSSSPLLSSSHLQSEAKQRYSLPFPKNYTFKIFPEDYSTYIQRFDAVMAGLKRGDSYLTNLTIKTPLQSSLSIEDIYHYSKATYKLCIPGKWTCFSPECFVRIEQGKISTFPMKGTIDARLSHAKDIIMNDYKEKAEHNTIVDLLRNDLSRIATSVKVSRFRFTTELQTNKGTILQVSSEIEGKLQENYLDNIGTLFFKLLPAGSVSGAPKESTVKIIKEAERQPRGFYTGVAGYFNGEKLESFVLIRFVEQCGTQLFFRSGGGITVNSNSRTEYEEAIMKIYLPL